VYNIEPFGGAVREGSDPAERVSIGCRRLVLQARNEPMWAAGLLRVWSSTPEMLARMLDPVLADLRLGRRRGRFTYRRESAAVDLVVGTVAAGMRRVLEDRAGDEHAAAVAALILNGLGIGAAEADAVVRRRLLVASNVHEPGRRRTRPSPRKRR